jgi:hypothetical protein
MKKLKFKIGDKVRVKETDYMKEIGWANLEGVIEGLGDEVDYHVKLTNMDKLKFMYEDELELIESSESDICFTKVYEVNHPLVKASVYPDEKRIVMYEYHETLTLDELKSVRDAFNAIIDKIEKENI